MLKEFLINLFDNPLSNFLELVLYQNSFFFLDGWSFVHFISGIILMFLIIKYQKKFNKYLVLFSFLVIYEVVEFWTISIGIVNPEIDLDVAYDLIYGMAGGFAWANISGQY